MSRRRPMFIFAFLCFAASCGGGGRVMSPPRVTAVGPFAVATALPPDTGTVVAVYVGLADAENSPTDLLVEVSRGAGAFLAVGKSAAAGSIAPGGDGLFALSAPFVGFTHRLLWKPPADLTSTETVRLRLTPSEPAIAPPPLGLEGQLGVPVTSAPFQLGTLPPDRS